jgi:hypothetical protein
VRARAGFLAGLIGAGLAALPAAFRFERDLAWQAFLVLFAGAALIMAPLSAALSTAGPPGRLTRSLTAGALVAALPLVPFAAMLKTSTHHRPLGGVTFAVIAGLVLIGTTLVCARLITWAGEQRSLRRTLARVSVVALTALGAASLVLGLVYGLKGDLAYRAGFFDALRVLGLATLAAWVPVPAGFVRRARGLGLATWIAVVTVGVCLGRGPVMQAELGERCPVLHWPLLWLGG